MIYLLVLAFNFLVVIFWASLNVFSGPLREVPARLTFIRVLSSAADWA